MAPVPDPETVAHVPDLPAGLVAASGEVTVERLRDAYTKGVFPWYSAGQPVLWWSPDPRTVLWCDEFRLHRSLRKTLARFLSTPGCEIRVDRAFDRVIGACASTPRDGQDGTWIVPEMLGAYRAWHRAGGAHSIETWMDGQLVGGLYGVNLGRMFFGESMFSHRTDASKIALAALVALCRRGGIAMIDCQQRTAHLVSMGAREIPRRDFLAHVRQAVTQPAVSWHYDPSIWELLDARLSPAAAAAFPHTPLPP
ncbi:leucyl/phenylalanyl-tRNA--protein transferase [Caldimonas brevitalea]|uniref:Leucyl/phenylalanyl-tRNA--protein transferase n=1 Tax=Caldimonas brevitalea TaxID=413882 RepID=A0A0G3BKF9_9BURK|nr:leucyl/phenylalanyl-tRNA--protein transferase [Caldimonas brevitalea]AKJ28478.1 leucyl/phenylalanyl-tRNA--protein transferase [Caldimonas brevitalea]